MKSSFGQTASVSRDLFVQDIPTGARSVSDIDGDWRPSPLQFGRDRVIAAITSLVPTADFSDPSWGSVELPGVSVEVNVGDANPLMGFALHVREAEPGAADMFIRRLLVTLQADAFDSSAEGGIFRRASA